MIVRLQLMTGETGTVQEELDITFDSDAEALECWEELMEDFAEEEQEEEELS